MKLDWEKALDSFKIPETLKATALIQAVGLWRIPLLFSVRPIVTSLDAKEARLTIPLNRWTKNHHGSMYFGALAIGADAVVGVLALHHMKLLKQKKIVLIFKDFDIQFHKRAEGKVEFICEDGARVAALVKKAMKGIERVDAPIRGRAMVKGVKEPVATFTLTLSLKRKE